MMKITLAVAAAAAVLTTAPPASVVKAQELKLAQGVDIQIGRDRYDRYDRYDRDRRRNDATVGIGPGDWQFRSARRQGGVLNVNGLF
jgi:hypothetical protein